MPSFDAIAELPLAVEGCEFEGLELNLGEFERLTTIVRLRGAGEEGVGEDVVYDAVDHIGQQGHGPPAGLAGKFTFAEFSDRLDEIDLFPAGAPVRGDVRDAPIHSIADIEAMPLLAAEDGQRQALAVRPGPRPDPVPGLDLPPRHPQRRRPRRLQRPGARHQGRAAVEPAAARDRADRLPLEDLTGR